MQKPGKTATYNGAFGSFAPFGPDDDAQRDMYAHDVISHVISTSPSQTPAVALRVPFLGAARTLYQCLYLVRPPTGGTLHCPDPQSEFWPQPERWTGVLMVEGAATSTLRISACTRYCRRALFRRGRT